MKDKAFKRGACAIIVFTMLVMLMNNSIKYAYADSASTLGTPEALGSPILNSNFSSENWDKWEMIVFGIYLSNFCVPLVDSYESAFTTSASYGSDGRGIQALEIGTGNSIDNNEIIEQLTTAAINFQAGTSAQQLYVSYTPITGGVIGNKTDPNNGGTVRAAKFSDLFLLTADPGAGTEDKSWASTADSFTVDTPSVNNGQVEDTYGQINYIGRGGGNLPTFYLKVGEKYIEVLDYTDSWDIQQVALALNCASTSSYSDEFYDSYKELYGENSLGDDAAALGWDSFGNIVCTLNGHNIIVIPASVNKHIAVNNEINLLNSFVLNGGTSKVQESIVNNGKQPMQTDGLGKLAEILTVLSSSSYDDNGTPAFASTVSKSALQDGTVILYKDSDYFLYNSSNYTTGSLMLDIMKNGALSSDKGLKIEAISEEIYSGNDPVGNGALTNTVTQASYISNKASNIQKIGIDYLLTPSGEKIDLFSDTVMVGNQMEVGSNSNSQETITRQLTNFIYEIYKKGSIDTASAGRIDKDTIESNLSVASSDSVLRDLYNNLWTYYKAYKGGYDGVDYDASQIFNNAEFGNRFTIVQIPSSDLAKVASLYSCSGGEFGLYSAYAYVTYLDFYGINSSSVLGQAGGNTTTLNTELFKSSAAKDFVIDNISGIMSQEQKQEKIINMSYLILSDSEEGKEYRNTLSKQNLASFINNQYQAIVYGSSLKSSGTAVGKSGFLTMASLSENPFTSSLIELYASIVIMLLTGIIILIVIAGLLMNKKPLWYFLTIVTAINVVLVLPSLGNISSNISNRITQNMFESKMTFWSVSEQVEDHVTMSNAIESSEDNKVLAELMDGLSIAATDRSLMVKKDISSKVTTQLSNEYKSAIQLSTARWILPIVMQKLGSNSEETENDYVYVNMLNMMDDASNVYMYYNRDDVAQSIGTISSNTHKNMVGGETKLDASQRQSSRYTDYVDTSSDTSYNGVNYRHIGYYDSNYEEMSHTYFYLLKAHSHIATPLCISSNGLVDNTDIESYQNYIDQAVITNTSAWTAEAKHIQNVSDEYSRTDLATMDESYGYLLNSESVYSYMYQAVEDSFASTESTASLIGKLQGQYKEDTDGNEVRDNFIHATSDTTNYTGDVRDVLDLQEFFTNNLPYMYKMWLSAGGFDGSSGVLRDEKIDGHSYYDGSNQSWFFRCNWAIKMFENEDLNGSTTVKDADGNRYTVDNMLIPSCYPSNRPMVFSRAQQNAYGLKDSDLSYVELKCVKVNEDAAIDWTSLLNYAGTDNITKEILLRQMALDATMIFNKEFTTATISSSKTNLYPTSLDLRSLSFDSIMKMVVLNITKDSTYVYGSTVETLISRTDIFTAALLLLTALICTYVIPLIRNIMALLILVLSVYAICRSILSSNQFKVKIIAGTLMSQVEIILLNTVYYAVFKMFIELSGNDEVLSVNRMKASVSAGNPFWALLILLAVSVAYVVVMVIMCKQFYMSRYDMGFDRYSAIIGNIAGKMSSSIENTIGRVGDVIHSGNESRGNRLSSFIESHRGYENSTATHQDKTKVEVVQTDNRPLRTTEEKEVVNSAENKEYEEAYYSDSEERTVTREKNRIDDEIDKGSSTKHSE